MTRSSLLLVALTFLVMSRAGVAPARDDALSPADYQWLAANLNVAHDSLTLQGLTADEKAHVHSVINSAKVSPDKRLMDVADYLYRVNGQDFQTTIEQSEH